jgi:hypothetical protein
MGTDTRKFWHNYLLTTSTYGTFEQRCPEYAWVTRFLEMNGLKDDDMIVDVGAGSCDMDHYLRTKAGWRGKYFPVDGATVGVDFNDYPAGDWLPPVTSDWYVCIETLEHVYDPENLIKEMMARAEKGIVVTTPNADVVDVVSVDSTHVMPIHPQDLERWGFSVTKVQFNDRHSEDTLIGFWAPDAEEYLPA